VVATWAVILVCQLRLRSAALRGTVTRPAYRMIGSPWTNLVSLAGLLLVLCLMPFANADQAFAFAFLPVLALVLWLGWRGIRRRAGAGTL
jgi:L-asparagine permease